MLKFVLKFILVMTLLFTSHAQSQSKEADTSRQTEDQQFPVKDDVVEDSVANAGLQLKGYSDAYFKVGRWNKGIGFPPDDINLQTPQAALEHLVVNSRNKNFEQAAYALNFNLMPDDLSMEQAGILAQKLYFVLEQRISIQWEDLSDRPDGQIDISTTTNKAIAGKPRRSVTFGTAELDGRDIAFRLQRIKFEDNSPIWLVSAQTVENIEPLYKKFGPRKLDRMIPKWISFKLFGIPVWKIVATIILLMLSYLISRVVSHYIRKFFYKTDKNWIRNIAYRLASPAGSAVGILIFYLLLDNLISFTGPMARGLYTLLLIFFIGIFTWLVMRVIDYIMDFFAENKVGELDEQNEDAKKTMTYISIGRRIFIFIIVILGISVIFSQFPSLERLGISLMASAGIATIVFGIAAQSTLGNIIAGIQIAITKPAKIGDAVIIEDSFGYVEDITFTYMVVKTWDLRRKVIPLKTVISNSFENLSMTNSQTNGVVRLYVDHRIDVSKVRAKWEELVKNSELWDGDEEKSPNVQVTKMTHQALEVRCLCSGKDFITTWNLHCELREKIVKYVGELENGLYLTKERVELEDRINQSPDEKNN